MRRQEYVIKKEMDLYKAKFEIFKNNVTIKVFIWKSWKNRKIM